MIKQIYRSLPPSLTVRIDTLRSYHQCLTNQSLPVFIHIPKNGGTSISKAIYSKTIQHLTEEDVRRTYGATFLKRRNVIAFIRDPIDRFVSAVNYLSTNGTSDAPASKNRINQDIEFHGINWFIQQWKQTGFLIHDQVLNTQTKYIGNYCLLYDLKKSDEILSKYNITTVKKLNISQRTFSRYEISEENLQTLRDYYIQDICLYKRLSGDEQ